MEPTIADLRARWGRRRARNTSMRELTQPAPVHPVTATASGLQETLGDLRVELEAVSGAMARLKEVYRTEPTGMSDRRARQVAATVVLGTTVGLLALLTLYGHIASVPVAVALNLVAPGAGWVLIFRSRLGRRWGLHSFLLSCVWSTFIGLVFTWTTWDMPTLQAGLVLAPAIGGGIVGWRRASMGVARESKPPSMPRPVVTAAGCLLLTSSVACVTAGILRSGHQTVDLSGLFPALGPIYALGIGLAFAAALLAIALPRPSVPLGISALGFIAAVYAATPAIASPAGFDGWAYKYIGVVDMITHHVALSNPYDVLQQWPGFFAVGAQIQMMTGVAITSYSTWATPFFVLLTALGVGICAQRVYNNTRVSLLTVLIFVSTMWVGQMYYAPQSYVFAMILLAYPILLDVLESLSQAPMRRGLISRGLPWFFRDFPHRRFLPRDERTAYLIVLVLTYLCIVVSHQLSPYAVLIQFAPFWMARWLHRSWRLGYVILGLVALAWLGLHYKVLIANTALTGFSFSNASSVVTGPTSPAQAFASQCAHLIVLVVLGATVVAVLAQYRALGSVLIPLTLAVMPVFMLLGGNYGGEAVYRVWVFATPWLCLLVAYWLCRLKRTQIVGLLTTGCLCFALWFAAGQANEFGMFAFQKVSPTELAASSWLTSETIPHRQIVYLTSSFPGRIGYGYNARNPENQVNDPQLMSIQAFAAGKLMTMTSAQIAQLMVSNFGKNPYLVVTKNMEMEGRYFGDLKTGDVARLNATLTNSVEFRLVFENTDTSIYSLVLEPPSPVVPGNPLPGQKRGPRDGSSEKLKTSPRT